MLEERRAPGAAEQQDVGRDGRQFPLQAGQASADGFDTIIHAPVRLRLCATLEALGEVEFGQALELLGVSKSALSKHVATLAEAGYVGQRRAVRDTRQRVWLYLTPDGHTAYRKHVDALRTIVNLR